MVIRDPEHVVSDPEVIRQVIWDHPLGPHLSDQISHVEIRPDERLGGCPSSCLTLMPSFRRLFRPGALRMAYLPESGVCRI